MTYEQNIQAQIQWHQDRINETDEMGNGISRKLKRKNQRAIHKLTLLLK